MDIKEKEITKVTTENVEGDVSEITYKKDVINKSGDTNAGGVTIQTTNNNQQNNNSNSSAVVQRPELNSDIDRDYQQAAYNVGYG